MPDHEYIDSFVEEHGHAPWIICGEEGYHCKVEFKNKLKSVGYIKVKGGARGKM